jgi:hypothetical protein
MAIHRFALIFDSVQMPETTDIYCVRALSRLVEVELFKAPDLVQTLVVERFCVTAASLVSKATCGGQ